MSSWLSSWPTSTAILSRLQNAWIEEPPPEDELTQLRRVARNHAFAVWQEDSTHPWLNSEWKQDAATDNFLDIFTKPPGNNHTNRQYTPENAGNVISLQNQLLDEQVYAERPVKFVAECFIGGEKFDATPTDKCLSFAYDLELFCSIPFNPNDPLEPTKIDDANTELIKRLDLTAQEQFLVNPGDADIDRYRLKQINRNLGAAQQLLVQNLTEAANRGQALERLDGKAKTIASEARRYKAAAKSSAQPPLPAHVVAAVVGLIIALRLPKTTIALFLALAVLLKPRPVAQSFVDLAS